MYFKSSSHVKTLASCLLCPTEPCVGGLTLRRLPCRFLCPKSSDHSCTSRAHPMSRLLASCLLCPCNLGTGTLGNSQRLCTFSHKFQPVDFASLHVLPDPQPHMLVTLCGIQQQLGDPMP